MEYIGDIIAMDVYTKNMRDWIRYDKNECETCKGKGTIDETIGGESFSCQYAKCPDCDGA